MKRETLNGLLLITILCFCGYRLARDAWALHRLPDRMRAIAASNQMLTFQSEGGLDVSGNPISLSPSESAKRTLVFLLRGESIGADLDFWHHVKSLLPGDAGLRLVGYCDGDACADAVRRDTRLSDFPVIVYAEIAGAQALVNADTEGNSILRKDARSLAGHIEWRAPGRTPLTVVQEALR